MTYSENLWQLIKAVLEGRALPTSVKGICLWVNAPLIILVCLEAFTFKPDRHWNWCDSIEVMLTYLQRCQRQKSQPAYRRAYTRWAGCRVSSPPLSLPAAKLGATISGWTDSADDEQIHVYLSKPNIHCGYCIAGAPAATSSCAKWGWLGSNCVLGRAYDAVWQVYAHNCSVAAWNNKELIAFGAYPYVGPPSCAIQLSCKRG